MKYFTKEYYTLELLSIANSHVTLSLDAERKDERFYQRMYRNQYDVFAFLDKTKVWSCEESHGFDEELCKRRFAERNNTYIKIYSQFPQEILEKIADIRVFALGFASPEVKRLLRPYCAKLRDIVYRIRKKAYTETDEAESYLTKVLGLNEYRDRLITEIEEKDGDIYLKGEEKDILLIKDGAIIEGKEKSIYHYNRTLPSSPWSRIIAAELHRIGDKFELHFLIMNCDEIEKEDLWYLTACGTDILEND